MNTIYHYAMQAELALASYALLEKGDIATASLIAEEFTEEQAKQFAERYTVVDQFAFGDPYEIRDPVTGEVTGVGTSLSGLSVTVFEDKDTKIRYLAIAGTDSGFDLLTDVVSIGILGSNKYQLQYQELKAKVQEWQASGVLPGSEQQQFTVTGPSLGGFLAAALTAEFPSSIRHTCRHNASKFYSRRVLPLATENALHEARRER